MAKKLAGFSTIFLQSSQTFYYRELQSLLRAGGWDIDIFCRRRMNEARFPFEHVHVCSDGDGVREKLKALIYGAFCYSKKFIDIFNEKDFDLIHAQFGPGGIYAMFYAKKFDKPLCVTFCGYDVPLLYTRRRFHPSFWRYWLKSKALFQRCTLVFAVSYDLANRLVALGVPAEKIRVFHRGVEIPEQVKPHVKQAGESLRCIAAGRFVEKKGFEYAIRAVDLVKKAGYDIILQLVGKGELREKCESLVNLLGIEDSVIFIDEMKQDELYAQYERNHVIIVPSVTAKNGDVEGIPNTIKEGGARGLVTITTSHAGCPEAVDDGISGFVVPERNGKAIADKLIYLCQNPDKIPEMGMKAAEKMKREFNLEYSAKYLESLYEEALERYRDA